MELLLNKGTNALVAIFRCLWYDAALYRGLNPEPPALEASTLQLSYQGDTINYM